MHVHRSNRTEHLLASLADVISEPLPDPFARECIVVQGRGMERWLAQALAARHGVFANARFPFPRALLEEVLASVLGKVERPGIDYEPESMMWSVCELLPAHFADARFRPVSHYLRDDEDGSRRVQLAQRIAGVFDTYATYRPEMVLAWEAAADDAAAARLVADDVSWQPVLWRALVARHGASHLAARVRAFLERVASAPPDPSVIPHRLCLFGFSTLPPLYVSALAAIARSVEVHLFILSPSSGYWSDIRSERESFRARRSAGDLGAGYAEDALHLDVGNPLLASMGRLGRDFQEILEGRVDYVESDADLYLDPLAPDARAGAGPDAGPCALHMLQSDILALRNRGRSDRADAAPLTLRADDASIRIHACHGPMREAEVLRDQLLDLFARDATLEPRDVVVMCPDVNSYAPYVEAVFAGDGEQATIPSRFSGRTATASLEIVDAFLRVLDALVGRASASEVLDLLGVDALRKRFGIDPSDATQLEAWVRAANVRWGRDAAQRREEGLPDSDQNTWRFGLDRLFLGYALPDSVADLVAGRAPVGGAEGQEAVLLGKLADFCDALFGFRERTQEPRTLGEWRSVLGELLERMLASDADTLHQHQQIRDGLEAIAEAGDRAGFGGTVDLVTLRAQLVRGLDLAPRNGAFLSGGVTFCEMVPMRTIPFRVVCLMGLDDTAFPRVRRPVGFDLLARHREPGDRSSRDDDRYLFLEALLSARDNFIVTYVGHGIRDNEKRPPSVLVGELLDYLATALVPEQGVEGESDAASIRKALVVEHRLQPFSPTYFVPGDEPALFSYSEVDCAAARALMGPRVDPSAFVPTPIEPSTPTLADERVIDLADLARFFERPVEGFMRDRLGLWLGRDSDPLPDREPITLERLDEFVVGDALLTRRLAGGARDDELALLRAQGHMPLGVAGAVAYAPIKAKVDGLERRVRALCDAAEPRDLEIDLDIGGHRLVGRLTGLYPNGLVDYRYSRLGQRSEVGAWVRHLALCCAAPPGIEARTRLVGRGSNDGDAQVEFTAPDDPVALLGQLIALYAAGLRGPLPLFEKASRAYASAWSRAKGDDPHPDALRAAAKEYVSGFGGFADSADVNVALAFGNVNPLDDAFHAAGLGADEGSFGSLARALFGPLLACRTESQ